MPLFFVNMSGRELTSAERSVLMDQLFAEDVDYKIHDVDHYDRYRHEQGISPLSRILEIWLKESVEGNVFTYADQLVILVPLETSLYDLHQGFIGLMHSWLQKPPRFMISYAYLTASIATPAMFVQQQIIFTSSQPVAVTQSLGDLNDPNNEKADTGMSLKEIQERYLPNSDIIKDLRLPDDALKPFEKARWQHLPGKRGIL